MDEALWSSVRTVLADRLAEGPSAQDRPHDRSHRTRPLDYGAYFDLVLKLPGRADLPAEMEEDAVSHLLRRLADMASPAAQRMHAPAEAPAATNLSPDCYSPPEIERFRRWWDIEPENAMGMTGLAEEDFDLARRRIDAALAWLRQAAPEMHDEVLAITSDIIMTRPDRPDRFNYGGATSFSLWGAFTINAQAHDGWPGYYRTIVHETGHNLLFAMAREEPLVADAPDQRHFSPLRQDPRPMDGIFHAAFVSARESLAFDRLLCLHDETGCLGAGEAEDLADMLQTSVIAFWDCERILRDDARLTPLGKAILDECETYMRANFKVEAD